MSLCCQAKRPTLLHGSPFHPRHGARVHNSSSVTQNSLRDLSRKKRPEFPKGKDSARGLKSAMANAAWLGLSELSPFSLRNENGTKTSRKIFSAYTEATVEKGFRLQPNQNCDLTGTAEAWPESCLTSCGRETLSKNRACSSVVRR